MPTHFDLYCNDCPYMNALHLPAAERSVRATPLVMEDQKASVLLIFQAPGVEEWETGKPISGTHPSSTGERMRSAFRTAGKAREDFNITNTVQCFPGKKEGRVPGRQRDKAPQAEVRHCCSNWLRKDIEAYRYERVIVFGSHAQKAVRELGYGDDPRFHFERHPTAGVTNHKLAQIIASPSKHP